MAFPLPPRPNQPIPNNPFYYPDGNALQSDFGPLIIGGGIFIDYTTGTISAGGTGPGGVNTILAGGGIFVSSNTGGVVTVSNTGALSLTAGNGIQVVNNAGNYTIINTLPGSTSSGTVTQVATGAGLTGGPITSSGTISLTTTGVGAGTYTNPTITIDAYGRITSASPGGSGAGFPVQAVAPLRSDGLLPSTISIDNASTLAPGAVQLNDTVTSDSTTQAATARVLKQTYGIANTAATNAASAVAASNAAVTTSNNAQLIANTAQSCALLALTNAALAQGDANQALTNAAAAQSTANTAQSTALNAQSVANSALSSASVRIPCSAFLARGNLLAGTGAGSFANLAPGTNGQVLVACSACTTGLTWIAAPATGVTSVATGAGLTGGPITSTGTIALSLSGVTAGSYTSANITVDAYGRITAAANGSGGGAGTVTSITAGTGLDGGTITTTGTIDLADTAVTAGSYTLTNLTVDAQGRITAATDGVAVTSVTAGTGLNGGTITTTGTIDLADTAVSPGSYTNATITVDQQGRLTAASSGAPPSGGTVTSITAGTGLTGGTITTSGTINLNNTTVSPGSYTYGSFTVDAQGRLTAASNGTAPVTSVTGTAPIVSSGGLTPAISLANTAVTPGSYTYSSFTVDAQGRLTAASSGAAPNTTVTSPIINTGNTTAPVIGIQTATTGQLGAVQVGSNIQVAGGVISVRSASTTQSGIVQLNDTVSSTSTTEALTAAQGKVLQDQINTLSVTSNLTFAGTFDAFTAQVLTVSSDGSSAGLTVGSNLPAPSLALTDFFVIVTTGGSYSPPGGGGPYFANQGDWFLCNGTSWQYVNVGTDLPVATTGTAGIVELATVAETETGTSTTLAVTPAGAAATYVPIDQLTGQGALITATAANTPATLALGTNGQVLTACNAASTGLCWTTAVTCVGTSAAFTGGPITTTGTLDLAITGVTANTYANPNSITVDACGRVTALSSAAASPITCLDFDAKGDLLAGFGSDSFGVLPVGSNGQVLTACSTAPSGLCWAPASTPSIPCACLTAKGDLITTSSPNTPVALPVGSNGQILAANSACSTGLEWVAGSFIPCACVTGKGAIITGTASSTPVALSVGSDGQVLIACSTCTEGLTWGAPGGVGTVTSITAGTGLTGGTITSAGTVALDNTAVTPGDYTYASLTVDAQGRLTAASSGTAPVTAVTGTAPISVTAGIAPDVSIASASTTALGAVQLTNALNNPSQTLALTAYAGQCLQQQITTLLTSPNIELAGTLDAGTGFIDSVTSVGMAAGYAVSSALPAATSATVNTYVIVTTPGTVTPPGGAATAATKGDWFLVSETAPSTYAWQFLNVGFDAPAATTSSEGVVCLSTNALAQAGTDTTTALTPAAAASAFIPNTAISAKGSLVTGTAANTPVALPVGSNGQILSANSACATGLEWVADSFIPCSCITGKGALVTGTAANTPTALPAGPDGKYLVACSACPSGLTWGEGCAIVNLYPVIRTANYTFNIPSPVFTPVTICYNVALCDSTGWYNGSTGVFRPTVPGYYQVSASARVYGVCNCTVEGALTFVCNGSNVGSQGSFGAVTSALSTLVYMNGSTDALCVTAVIGNSSGSNTLNLGNARFSAILAQAQVAPSQICGDTPVGAINWFGATAAPTGWLVADGRAVSRTVYSALFAVVGTTYGAGDGSTTFNLPDLRGQFLRGWDAAGGTARGCDPGRVFGSSQGFALQSHCHTLEVFGGGAGRPEWTCPNTACPAGASYPAAVAGPAIRTGGFTTTVGGTETRPTNVALLPCIKWAVTIAPATPSACGIPCGCITGKGALISGSDANTPLALPVGANAQVLRPNTACPTGLEWSNVGKSVSGIVNAGVCVCMDNIAVSMATSGNRGFGISLLSGTTTASWANFGINDTSYASAVAVQNFALTTTFQRFNNSYDFALHGTIQCTTLCYGSPVCAAYNIMGIVGTGYNNNVICITRIV